MPSADRPLLAVDGVTLVYDSDKGPLQATDRVTFTVHQGDRFVLLGPSGCGKSTLLKGVGGFVHPAAGEIRLDGRPVERPGPDRMMVFQEFDQLLPWKTVLENVAFPLKVTGRAKGAAARDRAAAMLERVGLAGFAESYPHALSGGMKQRVAIARGLVMEPAILLMDEPFAALDAQTRTSMQEQLLELWEAVRFTLLFVTHSIDEAILVGSRVLLLSPRPGRVKAEIDVARFGRAELGGAAFDDQRRQLHEALFADG